MGCGHSKINIYPRRNRNKNVNLKKTVTPESSVAVEETLEETAEVPSEEKFDPESDKKTIKVKPYGGPLLAHTELSTSQNNFFKMLDEKIENGPDYDSNNELEKEKEQARLTMLLKDWETASAGSRSLPATPKRRATSKAPLPSMVGDGTHQQQQQQQRNLNQTMVHQSYGVTPYRQSYNPPIYQQHQSIHHHQQQQQQQPVPPHHPSYSLQYQALSSLYATRPYNQQQMALLASSPVKSSYHQQTSSPKHIPYGPQQQQPQQQNVVPAVETSYGSPKMYSKSNRLITNGDLIQQQIYQQQLQYQQAREYQQYKQTREAQLLQQHRQQQQQQPQPAQFASGSATPRTYQSSIRIPMVAQDGPQFDLT